jgi:hypothetical protein
MYIPLSNQWCNGGAAGDGIPQIIWKGMASPNNQVSREDATAVASPKSS